MPLRWNYTLSPVSVLATTTFVINDGKSDDIGSIFHTLNTTSVNDRNDYQTRFAISTSEVATLIINKVTEREEAVYQCKLYEVGNTWAYNIRVIVKGKLLVTIVAKKSYNFRFGLESTLKLNRSMSVQDIV